MLTPRAVDRVVIITVFNWLGGLPPLTTTQQLHTLSGETLSTGWETSRREQEFCLPNRNSRGFALKVQYEQGVKEKASVSFSPISPASSVVLLSGFISLKGQ